MDETSVADVSAAFCEWNKESNDGVGSAIETLLHFIDERYVRKENADVAFHAQRAEAFEIDRDDLRRKRDELLVALGVRTQERGLQRIRELIYDNKDLRREPMKYAALAVSLKQGDKVLYTPSQASSVSFPAVVDEPPRLVGDTVTVRLRDLPPEYSRLHHPGRNRTTVDAAAICCIRLLTTP